MASSNEILFPSTPYLILYIFMNMYKRENNKTLQIKAVVRVTDTLETEKYENIFKCISKFFQAYVY